MLIGYSSMDPYSIIKIFECDFLIFIMLHILFQLISDAIRYGDCHKATMEMADYWLVEKQLVHKLFKVLVPRYENYNVSYIRMLSAPRPFPDGQNLKAVLELKGNPYPSLLPDGSFNRNLIHNVLLDEAKKAYRAEKNKEIAAKVDANVEAKKIASSADTSNTECETKSIEEQPTDDGKDQIIANKEK